MKILKQMICFFEGKIVIFLTHVPYQFAIYLHALKVTQIIFFFLSARIWAYQV